MATRRRFLAGTAAVLGFPAIIGTARAADAIGFVLPLGFSFDFFDTMNAYSGGHFARQGLDVKIIGANTGSQAQQLLMSGQVQFGRGSALDEIRVVAAQKTGPLAIATICQGCSFRVVSLKSKPIDTPADFRGKTIGIISNGSPTEIYLDLMLVKSGIPRDSVERQATGASMGAYEILRQGRVDGLITALSVPVALEVAGAPIVYWSPDRFTRLPGQVVMTTAAFAAAQPDLVIRCLKATKASIDEIMTNPLPPLFERAARDFEIHQIVDMKTMEAVQKTTIETLWLVQGRRNLLRNVPELWAEGTASLNALGITVADPAGLYTNKFVDAALA